MGGNLKCVLLFWKRRNNENVTSMQGRNNWSKDVINSKIGDVVLITHDNDAPLQSPLGRIDPVYNSLDNFLRVVKVRTRSANYKGAV